MNTVVIILFLNGSLLAENAISLPSPADSVQIKNSAFAGPVMLMKANTPKLEEIKTSHT